MEKLNGLIELIGLNGWDPPSSDFGAAREDEAEAEAEKDLILVMIWLKRVFAPR